MDVAGHLGHEPRGKPAFSADCDGFPALTAAMAGLLDSTNFPAGVRLGKAKPCFLCIDGPSPAGTSPPNSDIRAARKTKARPGRTPMTLHTGRHFLQIPGPTNVPDRVLRAMDMPTWTIAARNSPSSATRCWPRCSGCSAPSSR